MSILLDIKGGPFGHEFEAFCQNLALFAEMAKSDKTGPNCPNRTRHSGQGRGSVFRPWGQDLALFEEMSKNGKTGPNWPKKGPPQNPQNVTKSGFFAKKRVFFAKNRGRF